MITLNTDRIDKARITWEVTKFQPDAGVASEAVQRFVMLRDLECSVYEFINTAKNEYPEVASVLKRNSLDEDKHLLQLNELAKHLGINETTEHKRRVKALKDTLEALPDLDIVKAFVLEQVVFMCVLPEFCKEPNPNVANTATWILRDEVIHVYVNRSVCQQLNLPVSKELVTLCIDTLKFIYESYSESFKREMFTRAKKLLISGFRSVASEDTHILPGSINFFEVERSTIQY